MSPDFLLTAFVVCLVPGIGVVYTLSVTIGGGLRAGLLGLAAILHTSALLFQAVKWAGVAYLLWMARGALRGTGTLEVSPRRPADGFHIVRRGVLLNLLNPKLPLFFLAFLPQFVDPAAPATPQLVALGTGFVAMTAATFALYALAAGTMRDRLLASERAMAWMRRAFAATFAALAGRLALERA